MLAKQRKITYLDGIRLHRALFAGIQKVISRQDYLNKINVFPVADSDTGTNMAVTLNAIVEKASEPYPNVNDMLAQVADSALDGARGNSGVIMAQFLQGMSDGSKNVEKFTTSSFTTAIETGVNYAHNALSDPKEGTILSVLSAFSISLIQQIKSGVTDFQELLTTGIKKAERSLANTKNQLKVLKKAGVVDAGAQGFVDMLHGMHDFISKGSIRNFYDKMSVSTIKVIKKIDETFRNATDVKFRYCTECMIAGENIDRQQLRDELQPLGDSLVLAGSAIKAKVHIHVNKPADVFTICRRYGRLSGEKADDMIHQQKSAHSKHSDVAIITDSGADIPEGLLEVLDIYVIPLHFSFGEKSYVDKITMTATEFYQELRTNPINPTTSQPSNTDVKRLYQFLSSHYKSIVSINLSAALSGTLRAAEAIVKKMPEHKISAVDSSNVTMGQGLLVVAAAEAAQAGCTHEEILQLIDDLIPKTKIYVAMKDLRYAVRGGRVSKSKQRLANWLRITPILSVNPAGKATSDGVLFGKKQIPKRLAAAVLKRIDPKKTYRLTVAHCDNETEGKELLDILMAKMPYVHAAHIVECGVVVGVHAGPGSLGVGIQEYLPLSGRRK